MRRDSPSTARLVGLLLCSMLARRAGAQTGVVGGTVYRDTLYHQLTAAEISIPALNRRTVSNYAGDFRISGLPAGKYAVVLRHVGFAPLTDTVVVADHAPVDREYIMVEQAVSLDSVRVTAATQRYHSPRLNDFVERERQHNGGYFVDDSILRKNESRKIQDLVTAIVPGVHAYRPMPGTRPTFEYLSSGRPTKGANCPVVLYIDGIAIFSGAARDTLLIPDLNRYPISDYAGIEYYPGGASIPAQYNMTGNGCGVLLLWSRER